MTAGSEDETGKAQPAEEMEEGREKEELAGKEAAVVEDLLESESDDDESSESESEEEEEKELAPEKAEKKAPAPLPSPAEELDENSPEAVAAAFAEVFDSKRYRRREAVRERRHKYSEDLFNFPKDPEMWQEEDLRELWADAPVDATEPGWDPLLVDEEDIEIAREEAAAGEDPAIAPFYLPYRKHYPVIPDNHFDIANPKSAIEELDRIEEFLRWVSYVFADGSTYEGTVWDDLAHGRGVFVTEQGLFKYEGEWLRNEMEGHGVVEFDIPGVQPVPGSALEAKMRKEGRIISRDFMLPEDKRWLEMDMEDSVLLSGGETEVPFYESSVWVEEYGQKPEKGRYKYAGEWKHGRMHGCGVLEVNERITYGRFYFGDFVEEADDCDIDISTLHAGIAEVAAAKARMFVNKPDGMVREERGPYGDPQHPYFYEEDDVWMAPGFINQFYEVPDYWKVYAQEVDQEREMWLNSFYKAPLRLPMPAELEYWWSKGDDDEEFILVNSDPEPDTEDPSRLIYTKDPLILHTPTGRLIDFVEDPEHGVRLFWAPELEEGEDIDPQKLEFLPLGFDEFFGRVGISKKESKLVVIAKKLEGAFKSFFGRAAKWADEQRKLSESKLELIEKELEFKEAQLELEDAIEELDIALKLKQQEEEKIADAAKEKSKPPATGGDQDNAASDDSDVYDGDDDDDGTPASFGTAEDVTETSFGESKSPKSPFSSLSMSTHSANLIPTVPRELHMSFLAWKERLLSSIHRPPTEHRKFISTATFSSLKIPPGVHNRKIDLRAKHLRLPSHHNQKIAKGNSQLDSLARCLSINQASIYRETSQQAATADFSFGILSLHTPFFC